MTSARERSVRRRLLVGLAIAALLGALALSANSLPLLEWLERFREWAQDAGPWAVLVFASAYTGLTLVLGPASLLSALGGLVWGLWGIPIVIASATLAALAALLVGRYLARDRVRRFVARDRRWQSLVRAVSEGGWRLVALIRLSPVLPFGMQNYLLSVTDIRPLPYALATATAIAPSSALYVYLGSLGQTLGQSGAAGDASGADAAHSPLRWLLVGIGVLATALVIRQVSRRARLALAQSAHIDELPAAVDPDRTAD